MIAFEAKYDTILIANIRNTSVMGFPRIKLKCLKASEVTKPKIKPNPREITASRINYPKITNGVAAVTFEVSIDLTVLYKMMDTISLKTPSPKQRE